MKRFKKWWASLWGRPPAVSAPAITAPSESPTAFQRMKARQEQSPWKKDWNGNGTSDYAVWSAEHYGEILRRGRQLHDHPHSRPATYKPCPECHFPDFGWGGWDHYETCSLHRDHRPVVAKPQSRVE